MGDAWRARGCDRAAAAWPDRAASADQTRSQDCDRRRHVEGPSHPGVRDPQRRAQAAPKGESLRRGFPLEMDADSYGLDGFVIALSTTPGEPVVDYARETATWAIHAWPALPDTDAVFEIVTTRPPD